MWYMLNQPLHLLAFGFLLLANGAAANTAIWHELPQDRSGNQQRALSEKPSNRYFEADDAALRSAFILAPHETSGDISHHIQLPMPDGKLAKFSMLESPIMAPELAAKYPEIRTYRVIGVDDQRAQGRVSITPLGFSGMIDTDTGRVIISPDNFKAQDHVYRTGFAARQDSAAYNCGVHQHAKDLSTWVDPQSKTASRMTGSLQEFDLAVAATFEYYDFFDNPPSTTGTTSAIVMTINQVNLIYERDLGIRLRLVANNDEIYETVNGSLLGNNDALELLGQVNPWIDSNLTGGDSAYDIGHVFSRPIFGGGVANLGAVCNDAIKAGGVSGVDNPFMNPAFDIDLVAHEIGHQFNAEHSFNGTTSSCLNRNESTAYEPGSGSTIMAYAGICAAENLQPNSDATFHAGSIEEINAFVATTTCSALIATTPAGNNDPVIGMVNGTNIPANTPFLLDAMASDVDPNTLSYQWDQMNAGCPTDAASFGTDNGSNSLFRSYVPRSDSWRNFPALGTQLQGRYDKAEVLPCQNRNLDFRLTVRDGVSGQDIENVPVVVTNSAGPFEIINLGVPQALAAGTSFAVDWDVANTDLAPINCANVDIDLMTFAPGYASYSMYSLATMTANDGSESVTITPATSAHPLARIRVKCSDNIFYDISDADLTVTPTGGPVNLGDTDFTTQFYANIAITGIAPPACGAVVNCSAPVVVDDPPDSNKHDASAFGFAWMLLFAGLATFRHWLRPYLHLPRSIES